MIGFMTNPIKFLSKHKRVLRKMEIDTEGPGTILRDFEAFLDYFQGQPREVTGRHQIKLKDLPALNARLTNSLEHGLTRPVQKSFPHLNGLYLLLRASGLTYVDTTKKTPVLVVDDPMYALWQTLNPTERYCTLLETWLLRGHAEIIGERDFGWRTVVPPTATTAVDVLNKIPEEGRPVDEIQGLEGTLQYLLGWHNLGLMDLFGFVNVRPAPPQPGEAWTLAWVASTPVGKALLALLNTEFFSDPDIVSLEQEDWDSFGALQPVLRPYFPMWQTVLRPPKRAFRDGVHIFKIALWKDVWWRIAIPGDCVLDTLSSAILSAVRFSSDHLYMFTYQASSGLEKHIYHPYMDEGPWTSEVRVGDVPLQVGQVMDYNFDFGDDWHFAVVLERVDPPDPALSEPIILESHGEPPDQYPVYDDEEWE